MMMSFECFYKDDLWEFDLRILESHQHYYDLMVAANGFSYHIIVGSHAYGGFICIPNLGIGCELASFCDIFWNQESIARHLAPDNATYLALAIKQLDFLD
jgi:hypothetical protein